jgi:phosphoribosylformylglycinamidine cyclo-ligase
MDEQPLSYRGAGVDREAANSAKRRILELVRCTSTESVVSNPGGFGGLFRVPRGLSNPLLVASADGVGTKLKIASLAGRHTGVGADIVNHCADDILVEGARPLFFLDYIGMGRLDPGTIEQVIEGIAGACRDNGCALLGGETAEMPDVYAPGDYDLAGFIVGLVDEGQRPGAHRVEAGDVLVAVASDGFHTNGYSLLRRLFFDRLGLDVGAPFPALPDRTVGEVLLRPHRSYVRSVLPLIGDGSVHALAHITGGGIPDNLDRVIPDGASAVVDTASWTPPPEFRYVADAGRVASDEMFRTFNMGVGMVLIVRPAAADTVVDRLSAAGEQAWIAGAVRAGLAKVVLG